MIMLEGAMLLVVLVGFGCLMFAFGWAGHKEHDKLDSEVYFAKKVDKESQEVLRLEQEIQRLTELGQDKTARIIELTQAYESLNEYDAEKIQKLEYEVGKMRTLWNDEIVKSQKLEGQLEAKNQERAKTKGKECFGDFNQAKEDSDKRNCHNCDYELCNYETQRRYSQEATTNISAYLIKLEGKIEAIRQWLESYEDTTRLMALTLKLKYRKIFGECPTKKPNCVTCIYWESSHSVCQAPHPPKYPIYCQVYRKKPKGENAQATKTTCVYCVMTQEGGHQPDCPKQATKQEETKL